MFSSMFSSMFLSMFTRDRTNIFEILKIMKNLYMLKTYLTFTTKYVFSSMFSSIYICFQVCLFAIEGLYSSVQIYLKY